MLLAFMKMLKASELVVLLGKVVMLLIKNMSSFFKWQQKHYTNVRTIGFNVLTVLYILPSPAPPIRA